MAGMSDYEEVPVVGGPLDGKTRPWSTSRLLMVPDARDMVTVIADGEARTLFGQHTYELKCYAKGGEKKCQWEHVSYEPPEAQP
jgi:hypothetical protein